MFYLWHFIHSSVDGYMVASMSWLLHIVMLWILGCMYLFKLEFPPDIYPEFGLQNNMTVLILVFFLGHSILFSIVTAPIYIPPSSVGGFKFSTPSPALLVVFLMMTILTGVKWYLIVALIGISLIISTIEHFCMFLLAVWMYSLEKYLLRSSAHYFEFGALNQL